MLSFNPAPENRGHSRKTAKLKIVSSANEASENNRRNPLSNLILLLLAGGTLFFAYHLFSGDKGSPTIINEDGEEVILPERQAKLDKELEEIDHAQQYALIATANKLYPCFTCPNGAKTIYLNIGETWKFGVTRKGESGRYPRQNYGVTDVAFLPQFQGTYSECLKQEKIKIYNYPLMLEAKRRKIKLFRPPGNANDS